MILLLLVLALLVPPAEAATPEASDAAARIVGAWSAFPHASGNPIDPVSGVESQRYSQATLADAALATGQPAFAERLLLWLAAAGPQTPASVFEIGAAADSFLRLPADSPARGPLLGWLRDAPSRVWIEDGAARTFNKWMVEADAALARCLIAELPARAELCALGRRFVQTSFPAAARRWTSEGVTVVSDPGDNPIAYHQLTLGYFAHALSRLGTVSAAARRTLVQMARGSLAITAPDGDAAYWGRSQGQAWTLPLGAYGLRRAQAYTTRAEAARFEHTAQRMLARYRAHHDGGPLGVAIVPAYQSDPLTRFEGVDPYANVATYAGLAAMALTWLAQTDPGPASAALPTGGHAQDRGNGAFATATAHGTWLAVRAHGHRSGDPRYDFGLVAAKRRTVAGWVDLVAHRPAPGTAAAPIGPLLTVGGVTGRPDGETVRVTRSGTIVVTGGWRRPGGGWLRRARFTFRPTATGVVVTMPVRGGDQLSYSVFGRAPRLAGGTVVDGDVRTAFSLPGGGTAHPEPYASASERRLTRVTLTAVARATGTADIVVSV